MIGFSLISLLASCTSVLNKDSAVEDPVCPEDDPGLGFTPICPEGQQVSVFLNGDEWVGSYSVERSLCSVTKDMPGPSGSICSFFEPNNPTTLGIPEGAYVALYDIHAVSSPVACEPLEIAATVDSPGNIFDFESCYTIQHDDPSSEYSNVPTMWLPSYPIAESCDSGDE